ncbi:MAG: hypothetical protein WAS33_03865, partial [Candidatus Promineifilaceae bacterium]
MNEERKMILTMLAEGKISAEEANTLLEALDVSEAKPTPSKLRMPSLPPLPSLPSLPSLPPKPPKMVTPPQ